MDPRNVVECSDELLMERFVEEDRKCFRMSEMGISLSKTSKNDNAQENIEQRRLRKKGVLSVFMNFVPVVSVPVDAMDVDLDLSMRKKQKSISYSSFADEMFLSNSPLLSEDEPVVSSSISPTSILNNLHLSPTPISIVKKMMIKMKCEYQFCTEFAELVYNKINVEKFKSSMQADLLFAAATIWIVLKYEIDHIPDTAFSLSNLVLSFEDTHSTYTIHERNMCAQKILFAEGEIFNQLNWNLMCIIEPYKTWLQRRLLNVL